MEGEDSDTIIIMEVSDTIITTEDSEWALVLECTMVEDLMGKS